MKNYAVIQNNTVTNVIVWDGEGEFTLAPGMTLTVIENLPSGVWMGWSLNNGTWSPPVPPKPTVPVQITSTQARRVINAAGLRPSVEAAVAQADKATQDLWYTAEFIERDNPLVISLGAALGLTSKQLDDLFIQAVGM